MTHTMAVLSARQIPASLMVSAPASARIHFQSRKATLSLSLFLALTGQ
jgi:hypothetical protein